MTCHKTHLTQNLEAIAFHLDAIASFLMYSFFIASCHYSTEQWIPWYCIIWLTTSTSYSVCPEFLLPMFVFQHKRQFRSLIALLSKRKLHLSL